MSGQFSRSQTIDPAPSPCSQHSVLNKSCCTTDGVPTQEINGVLRASALTEYEQRTEYPLPPSQEKQSNDQQTVATTTYSFFAALAVPALSNPHGESCLPTAAALSSKVSKSVDFVAAGLAGLGSGETMIRRTAVTKIFWQMDKVRGT